MEIHFVLDSFIFGHNIEFTLKTLSLFFVV